MKVIGYEGKRSYHVALNYGCAGIESSPGMIANSCWGGFRKYDEEEREDLYKSGAFEVMEAPILLDEFPQGSYVLDLPNKLACRDPYYLGDDDVWAQMRGVVGKSSGPTRTYYLFESLEKCTHWLANLHLGKFVLTSQAEMEQLYKLAYLGDHHFEDLTYKARLDELVPIHRAIEKQRDEARALVRSALRCRVCGDSTKNGTFADAVARWNEEEGGGDAPAYIMPAGRPGDVANVSGLSVEDAERIVRLANKASDVRKLGTALAGIAVASLLAQRDEEKMRAVEEWKQANGYEDLIGAYSDSINRANKLEVERDEARALVRRYVSAARNHADDWDAGRRSAAAGGTRAVARWDEEEKKR